MVLELLRFAGRYQQCITDTITAFDSLMPLDSAIVFKLEVVSEKSISVSSNQFHATRYAD
ncbi:hypothetical protein K438DRAFT_1796241, partial [Mycena galopus ATCC 62051]